MYLTYMLVLVHMCAFTAAGQIGMPYACSPDTIISQQMDAGHGLGQVHVHSEQCLTHFKRVNQAHAITQCYKKYCVYKKYHCCQM